MVVSTEVRKAQMRLTSSFNYALNTQDIKLRRLEKRLKDGDIPFISSLLEHNMSVERANELAGRVLYERRPDGSIIRNAPRKKQVAGTQTVATNTVGTQTTSTASQGTQSNPEPVSRTVQTAAQTAPATTTRRSSRVAARTPAVSRTTAAASTSAAPTPARASTSTAPPPRASTSNIFTRAMLLDMASKYRGDKFQAGSRDTYINQMKSAFNAIGVDDDDDIVPWYKDPAKLIDAIRNSVTARGMPPSLNTIGSWMGALGTWIELKKPDNTPLPALARLLTNEERKRFDAKVAEVKDQAKSGTTKDVYDWETVVKPALQQAFEKATGSMKLFLWVMLGNVDGIPRPDAIVNAVAVKNKNDRPELDTVYSMNDKTLYARKHKTSNAYDIHFSLAKAGPLLGYIKESERLFPKAVSQTFTKKVSIYNVNFSMTAVRSSWDTMVYNLPEGPLRTRYIMAMKHVTGHSLQTSKDAYVRDPITAEDLLED